MANKQMEKQTSTSTSTANITYLIIALIILFIGIIFALQNADESRISFMFWEFRGSMAVVLFITFMAGIVIGVFTSIANLIRKDRIINKQAKNIQSLENRVDALQQEHNQKN